MAGTNTETLCSQSMFAGRGQQRLQVRVPVGFTSNASHWGYLPQPLGVERSLETLGRLCDMRTPVDLTEDDCRVIGRIVRRAAETT